MVAPPSVFSYDVKDRSLQLVKQKEIPNYNPDLYETKRVEVKAHDGATVPVSLVFRKVRLFVR